MLALASCGGSSRDNDSTDVGDRVIVPRGVKTPSEVVRAGDTGKVTVRGSVMVQADGEMWLCDGFRESAPPQCMGEHLVVEGLEPADVPGIHGLDGSDVRWSDRVVDVRGSVSGSTLRATSIEVA